MLSRATNLLDGRCQRVIGGTFHSFCLDILRQHAAQAGLPDSFTVLDSSDAADVIDVLRGSVVTAFSKKRFPKKRTLQVIYSAVRNREVPLKNYLQQEYPQFLEYGEILQQLFEEFQRYKLSHGIVDYDDLILRTLGLFEHVPNVLASVSSRARYVLVDEYQDTNRAQARLVRMISSTHGNVMVVGDDAQSIYRFRGADYRNILDYPSTVAGTRILKLEQNYRSVQPILDLSNHLIASSTNTFDKVLFSDRKEGMCPVYVSAPDAAFESRFVAQMVLELREQGTALSDMAVLFRNGFNAYDLEIELNRKKIPFVKYGGLKLSEAAHVKDVLAYFRVLENPRDSVAWNRILQLLPGIGPRIAERIRTWIDTVAEGGYVLEEREKSPRYISDLRSLFHMLRSIHQGKSSVVEQLKSILDYYQLHLERAYPDDHQKRLQDLDQLVDLSTGFKDRQTMLASLALDPIDLTASDVEALENDEAPLILSTIHSAKGLEFKVVFIIRVLDGIVPSAYAEDDSEALDEELRLLYVAITRAADELYVTYPTTRYSRYEGRFITTPSRFLSTIPEALLEPGTIVEEDPDAADKASPMDETDC